MYGIKLTEVNEKGQKFLLKQIAKLYKFAEKNKEKPQKFLPVYFRRVLCYHSHQRKGKSVVTVMDSIKKARYRAEKNQRGKKWKN